jgi:hypothetical protein
MAGKDHMGGKEAEARSDDKRRAGKEKERNENVQRNV